MCVTVVDPSTSSASSTPVTVIVRSRSQFPFAVVNVNDAGNTDTAPVSLDVNATVTAAVGSVAKRTVYDAVAPSPTLNDSAETTNPTDSSSTTVTVTVADTAL